MKAFSSLNSSQQTKNCNQVYPRNGYDQTTMGGGFYQKKLYECFCSWNLENMQIPKPSFSPNNMLLFFKKTI